MTSILKVNKLDPQSGTALEIGSSGDTITVPSGATLDISSATLTPPATLPASSGVNLTALNATNLGSGTVPTARLGSGTASSSTFLRGDQTYAAAGGGKVLQVVRQANGATDYSTSSSYADVFSTSITCASASNYIYALLTYGLNLYGNNTSSAPEGNIRITLDDNTNKAEQYFYADANAANWSKNYGFAISAYWAAGTTSAVTIKCRSKAIAGRVGVYGDNSNLDSTAFTVMEIEA